MKFPRAFALTLALCPAIAFAHPGHDASALHLHLGAPTASTSSEIWLLGVFLALASVGVALRSLRSR